MPLLNGNLPVFGEEIDPVTLKPVTGPLVGARLTNSSFNLEEAESLCPTDQEIEETLESLTPSEKAQLVEYAEFMQNRRWLLKHHH